MSSMWGYDNLPFVAVVQVGIVNGRPAERQLPIVA
jgi:hypothetical protein